MAAGTADTQRGVHQRRRRHRNSEQRGGSECEAGNDSRSPREAGGGKGDEMPNSHAECDRIDDLKEKMERLKKDLVKQFEGRVEELVQMLVHETALSLPSRTNENGKGSENTNNRNLKRPPEEGKLFLPRKSLLDELFEMNHVRTIYHMFIAALILFIISTIVVDFIDEGRLVLEFDLLAYAFGQLPTAIFAWVCMFLSALMVPYCLLASWARAYHAARARRYLVSVIYGFILATYQVLGLGAGPVYVALWHKLPPASCFIVILEQVRLVMKVHSFVRENVPLIMKAKDGKQAPVPTFGHYLYFLFCPTLIYRDTYPRTATIRWKYVAINFAQVLGCLFYAYYILVRLCIPLFHNFSKQPYSLRILVLCIFNCTLPGVLVLFLAFFAFLHCWLNAFAEMLRFADRMFYQDWWNSTSFANYYRSWNVVVHDWLYYYAYKDFRWLFRGRFRAAAMLSVFTLSAVVHEYVITICLGFFYPVLFCLFLGFGLAFNFLMHDKRTSPIWNVVMWTEMYIGLGIIVCLYSQEWYAQQQCPLRKHTFLDLITPRSWSCKQAL
uniref:sterol O-acyltransferase 1-like isoform X2 n=1 Tax=Myxine glutinosa TaxID=7769 RepID=UPI00358EF5CA